MLNIGCHLSSSKGFTNMAQEAISINATTFQFFTRNPRGSKAKEIDLDDIENFKAIAKNNNINIILAHAPYTLNPCSTNEDVRNFALDIMKDDIRRMELIPGNMYNFHPGSHLKQGIEYGTELISNCLNKIITKDQTTTILLETMSGKGTEVGSKFEELKHIIDKVNHKNKIGICLDTCHVYDAGYDIVNNLEGVLESFDKIIGLEKLKAIHLNDSKNTINSHKDRHEVIGNGTIGFDNIMKIVTHKKLCNLPFYLETPNDLYGHKKEIDYIKKSIIR